MVVYEGEMAASALIHVQSGSSPGMKEVYPKPMGKGQHEVADIHTNVRLGLPAPH